MAKQLQVSIPEPCHEGWETMTPSEKGRFCGSCQKQVVDFSVMSDREIAEFFKRSARGSVCGHFQTEQLDRTIDIPKKRIPWVKYFFQFTLPAFLLSMKVSAQRSPRKTTTNTSRNATLPEKGTPAMINKAFNTLTGDTVITPVKSCLRSNDMADGMVMIELVRVIKGFVTDQNGEPLPGATLRIKGTNTATAADQYGKFSIAVKEFLESPVLQASYVGFDLMEQPLDELKTDSLVLRLTMQQQQFTDGVIVVTTRKIKKEIKDVPLLSSFENDNKSGFKVFPNPATPGGQLSIESKKLKAGEYSLVLLDQTGQSVHQQEIRIEEKIKTLQIDLPQVAAGSYFLVLTDKKTGKKYSEKIIIQ